ncbi:transmembrane protein [Cutibacterium acnes JCM 18909]|nr:transmembrane protein [Cutibacterium acnes JCM 18909]
MTVVVGRNGARRCAPSASKSQILKGGREVARATRALAGRVSVREIPSVALEHVADDVEVLAQARRAQAVAEAFPTPSLPPPGNQGWLVWCH